MDKSVAYHARNVVFENIKNYNRFSEPEICKTIRIILEDGQEFTIRPHRDESNYAEEDLLWIDRR